jgi:hypothetical protein
MKSNLKFKLLQQHMNKLAEERWNKKLNEEILQTKKVNSI